jgi:hypothetical protein
MASVSGLNKAQRLKARQLTVDAAFLALNNKPRVHYTQGSRRWDGINKDLKAHQGEYPRYCDCSSFATWCIWNGLDHYDIRDTVNGLAWKAGYTGTMLNHGKRVVHQANLLRGDCVIYGRPGSTGAHTAIIVGTQGNTPMVISHGSEAGPFYVRYDYRPDIIMIRRYI